jgi:hypothetical protein
MQTVTVKQSLAFKENVRTTLERNPEPKPLIDLVGRFASTGGSKTEIYETLQELWLEYGFDNDEHRQPAPKRDALELVMEHVWYWSE